MAIRDAARGARAIATLFALATASTHAGTDEGARIIDEGTRAAGGLAAARAIAALEYRIHIKEATYEAEADYFVDRTGRMRIDVHIDGKRVYTECLDGAQAWQMGADGVVTQSSASGKASLWHGTQYPGQILSLTEHPAHGHRVTYIGTETVAGIPYDVLQLSMSDGFTTFRYLDPDTHLSMRSRDTSALHPDIDPEKVPLETAFSDYRRIDGVMRPFLSTHTDLRDGKWLQTVRVISIQTLPALPNALFVRGSLHEPLH